MDENARSVILDVEEPSYLLSVLMIELAVARGDCELVTELLSRDGSTVEIGHLHQAVSRQSIDMVKTLLLFDAPVNMVFADTNNTPLMTACTKEDVEIARLLLDNGARVDVRTEDSTPLITACRTESVDLVRLLVERGADIRESGVDGTDTLSNAVYYGSNIEIARLLLDLGADVNATDDWTWTPLHYSCFVKAPEISRLLIERGADVNRRTRLDTTPLHTTRHDTTPPDTTPLDTAPLFSPFHH